ncbi:hypothetical protein SK128_001282 [Halocaridina rubra]|uniref:C-type lectin domain-containing protein n=1 Tax=Halocaridina rubra TaxID=373956 RepID=A0AAN8ZP77_HALRR
MDAPLNAQPRARIWARHISSQTLSPRRSIYMPTAPIQVLTRPNGPNCSSPFEKVDGVGCIHIDKNPRQWQKGREFCRGEEGDLYVAEDPAQLPLLWNHLSTQGAVPSSLHWVGALLTKWFNGRPISLWKTNEPDAPASSQPCHAIHIQGKISNEYCSMSLYSICERRM